MNEYCADQLDISTVAASFESADDGRVADALEEFLRLRRLGLEPDRAAFLSHHAEIAECLAECLDGLALIQSAASQLSPARGRSAREEEALPPSTRLGEYRIVREVGRGGMGVVYEAEQVSLGRRVALKVLPLAAALDPRQRQRFQLEAQAAALLNHPHIVPVFGVGSDQGVPYFAMQFVEGWTLAELIRDQRRLDGLEPASPTGGTSTGPFPAPEMPEPPPTSDTKRSGLPSGSTTTAPGSGSSRSRPYCLAAAKLALQAAEALEHAHAIGVVHRDVKPSNLMVDRRGHLWVTDFGLALFQDEAGLTRTGDLVGTLRYMSPEQVRGGRVGIDQRTDVYALGVTLYELLTLRPAHDARGRQVLIDQITLNEPAALRRLNPAIPRDLETIVLKAMAKDPAHRYASARELADDLRRFLDDQPVKARRPTVFEHAAKWARRHRAVVVTASTVLLLAAAVGTALLYREQQETARMLASYQRERGRELQAVELSFDTIDRTLFPVAGSGALSEDKRHDLYRTAISYYDRIADTFQADAELRVLAARADKRAGEFRSYMQDPAASEKFRRSIETFEALVAASPDRPAYREELVNVLQYVGWSMLQRDEMADAAPLLERALEVERTLADELPRDLNRRVRLTNALNFVAALRNGQGRPCEARQLYRESLRIDPDQVAALGDLAWLLALSADASPTDAAEAQALARKVIERAPDYWPMWDALGLAMLRAGNLEDAAQAVEHSMEVRPGVDPDAWLILSMIRWKQGDKAEARRLYVLGDRWINAVSCSSRDHNLRTLREQAATLLGQPLTPIQPVRATSAS